MTGPLRFYDLAASQARSANLDGFHPAADFSLDLNDIGFPNTSGFIVGVADIVASYRAFAAYFASPCHIYFLVAFSFIAWMQNLPKNRVPVKPPPFFLRSTRSLNRRFRTLNMCRCVPT